MASGKKQKLPKEKPESERRKKFRVEAAKMTAYLYKDADDAQAR
jgi:hypothetical protein